MLLSVLNEYQMSFGWQVTSGINFTSHFHLQSPGGWNDLAKTHKTTQQVFENCEIFCSLPYLLIFLVINGCLKATWILTQQGSDCISWSDSACDWDWVRLSIKQISCTLRPQKIELCLGSIKYFSHIKVLTHQSQLLCACHPTQHNNVLRITQIDLSTFN